MRVSLKILIAAVRSTLLCFVIVTMFGSQNGAAQATDPGIRNPPAGCPDVSTCFGPPLAGLAQGSGELNFFLNYGVPQFTQVEAFKDGLGPRFNLDSCAGCHIFPAVGGSSPPPSFMNPDGTTGNPQFGGLQFGSRQIGGQPTSMAPSNTAPFFITQDGPVREVRFIHGPDGRTPDGGVHGIFTVTGRLDAPTACGIRQPDFSNTANMIFRIPTPVFGAGLIESITDKTIRDNLTMGPFSGSKLSLGITGHVNTNGNDGTVTRFGWKAQNKSLLIFAGEAYNVEMGITNENFQTEREQDPNCATNPTAENHTDFGNPNGPGPADIVAFMGFMRFLDQPIAACGGNTNLDCSSVNNGRSLFVTTGCAACHTPTLKTGLSPVDALSQKPANLFSDLAVHHMGTGLADFVTQGTAGPDEFRTSPLWGLGQRAFFLHDGRTSDLLQAILAHNSPGSEAFRVIGAFQLLSTSQQQDLLNFLRSL
jgi:CxxC motif-containing protein (DUF1111 family)